MEVTFIRPLYLWLLLLVPIFIFFYFLTIRWVRTATLKFANFVALSRISGGLGEVSNVRLVLLKAMSLVCIILAISGMTVWYIGETARKDYVIAIDSSASMLNEDTLPTRLGAVKESVTTFIDDMPLDSQMSIVSFSGASFVESPMTYNRAELKEAVSGINASSVGGTDFADALISSTNILSVSEKAKTIVLITDGRNNVGLSTDTAIAYAISHHVTIYTVAIGSEESSFSSDRISLGVDKEELQKIAELTFGSFYEARGIGELNDIFEDISSSRKQGKIPINMTFWLIVSSLVLLLVDWLLGSSIYRRIP